MSLIESPAGSLSLTGGQLALDFANTVSNVRYRSSHDYLQHYSDLVAWSEHTGILSSQTAKHLLQSASARPRNAHQVLKRAVLLREVIYRIILRRIQEQAPEPADVAILNRELAAASRHLRLMPTAIRFEWQWAENVSALDAMLWHISRAAADLFTSAQIDRVSQCSGDDCCWLFLDASKNQSRRWCAMSDCGNRAKARRHYAKIARQNGPSIG